jgi:hypothetical protein
MNKKANIEEFMKIALWILFFVLVSGSLYYLLKFLFNQ